jgi:methionyl aminopeptidase
MSENIQEAFERTRAAGIVAASALDEVAKIIKPGITTNDIDNLCYEFINDNGAYSAPLFYRGFPKSCCTSANHVICQNKILNEGDIVNVDVTAFKNNWHGDTSRMFHVGDVSVKAKKLTEVTYNSMMRAIKILSQEITLGDIGSTIQSYVEEEGFSVVRDFCGHGIGKVFCTMVKKELGLS